MVPTRTKLVAWGGGGLNSSVHIEEPTRSFAGGGTVASNGNYAERREWRQVEIDVPMREHIECSEGYVNMVDICGDDGRPPVSKPKRRRRVQSLVT